MNRCAGIHAAGGYGLRRGFTLLELCIVLLIMAILLGAMMPAFHSAFIESSMRADARQLSFMVRTAMLQSGDEHRGYVLDLTATNLDLHLAGAGPEADSSTNAAAGNSDGGNDDSATYRFDAADKLYIPDPKKNSAWIHMPAAAWIFQPGELCPATRVRLMRGNAWLEMSFNALTGNVENEADYFP
jgi:prepilin-type N-terminal cleavage/methylation domain-containing protein